ncbi:hypothetical protein PHPALM_31896 [Phytophthora palmivora]|uniref:WLGC domain-containing protein n=1 Tax=Phytophthora palmivora TaxID=4796 RepID=A0A2P4X1H1_9STRA|nr:hypothetical protein PHPALM_31896 [Phytophthora palmivora]
MKLFPRGRKVAQGPTKEKTLVAKLDTTRGAGLTNSAISVLGSLLEWRQHRFSVIGWGYVIFMTLIFLLSSAWSLLLIILNLEPSKSANYFLQTENLDNGHFWQSQKASSSILVTTTVLLLVVIGVYWYLLYLLLFRPPSERDHQKESKVHHPNTLIVGFQKHQTLNKTMENHTIQCLPIFIARQALRMIISSHTCLHFQNVLMEIPEVILQILSLREHMAQGLDPSLLYCYASLMALNAFVAFFHIQFRWNEATLHHILKDSIVDAAFAVFFPALVLFYSFFVFQDDLKTVKIRQRFFPPREFERKARNYVNAKELNMFTTDFESLLVRSWWDAFLRLSFNILACFRWFKITFLLLQRQHKSNKLQLSMNTKIRDKAVSPFVGSEGSNRQNNVNNNDFHRYIFRTMISIFFLLYGVSCIVYTVVAVRISREACSLYPQCVQFSYFVMYGAPRDICQCLAYVDRDLAPAHSENLTDATQVLAQLAASGKLQSVQLVNRKINGSLPVELQGCQNLRNMVLIHTGVNTFPSWTSTSFANLEYLHLEGDTSDTNLAELPSDFFYFMSMLHTLHLSYHPNLPSLPSLNGLKTLESVYFGYLDSITKLPSTGSLPAIQVMALEGLPQVRLLPDVSQYESTLEMMFVQDMPACCSGFLSEGNCNTTFPSCCDRTQSNTSGSLPSICLVMPDEEAFLPTNATLAILNHFATNTSNFCDVSQATCPRDVLYADKQIADVCAGVLYRKCTSESQGVGICFNEDMRRVQCTYSATIIDMRMAEIAAGCDCDMVEELWLGCTGGFCELQSPRYVWNCFQVIMS